MVRIGLLWKTKLLAGNGQNFKEGAWVFSTKRESQGDPWLFVDSPPWDDNSHSSELNGE